jgi:hypothetical protein
MISFLWKVFGVLFPFLQEIFFGKKIQRNKKKPQSQFYHHSWFKNTLLGIGLASFLLVFYLGYENYLLRKAKPEHTFRFEEPKPITVEAASAPASAPTGENSTPISGGSPGRPKHPMPRPAPRREVPPPRTFDQEQQNEIIRKLKEMRDQENNP